MNLCILCEVSKIDLVRKKMRIKDILLVKLSENGKDPATHYFCSLSSEPRRIESLMNQKEYTIMEISETKEFLQKWNLKIIKK